MTKSTIVTVDTVDDPELKSILRQALVEYHEAINERRRSYADAAEQVTNGGESILGDDPMTLIRRANYFHERYERMYQLLIAVDFGNVTFTYNDDGVF